MCAQQNLTELNGRRLFSKAISPVQWVTDKRNFRFFGKGNHEIRIAVYA